MQGIIQGYKSHRQVSMQIDDVRQMVADSLAAKQRVLADDALMAATLAVAQHCEAVLRAGGKVMLAGNGGSAADAQHIAAELVARFEFDRPGLPALALSTDTSMLTAIGNDYGYEYVFSRQVQASGRPGDVFIGISTSGNSKNVVKAVEAAKAKGISTVALCGSCGCLAALCDFALAVPSAHTPRIQENHILLGHILCALIEESMFGESHRKPKQGG